jgi:hypothetical protein
MGGVRSQKRDHYAQFLREQAMLPCSYAQIAADLARDIPEDVLRTVLVNGAARHDHYLYATPKRN